MKSLLHPFFFGTVLNNNKVLNTGWTLFRLHVGLSIAIHAGMPKLPMSDWFVQQVSDLGFRFPSPQVWAYAATWGEIVGGFLIAVGLLTRFAAAQLVFQFFIVSFIWYDKPEPVTGMYFQQLLFWAFVLITVVGGGRYSVDYWLSKRGVLNFPKRTIPAIAAMLLLCSSTTTFGQDKLKNEANQLLITTPKNDLKQYTGSWSGTLTYLDYSSQRTITIKATVEVKQEASDSNNIMLAYDYPNEPGHEEKEIIEIRGNQFFIEGQQVIMEKDSGGNSLQFVVEKEGMDNNRRATVRRTFYFSRNAFSIKKEVRHDGAQIFFVRHEYKMLRH